MPSNEKPRTLNLGLGAVIACLAVTMIVLFHRSFGANQTLFSNDGPLGAISAESLRMPGAFKGVWNDLNWVGVESIGAAPLYSVFIDIVLGTLNFSKFFVPLALLTLGLGAWAFFRSLKFHPAVCLLGALASALNMNTFSHSCWGLGTRALVLASAFFAMAAVQASFGRQAWAKVCLGGLAVGMAVMEGFDVGAIFSIYVAAFVVATTAARSEKIGVAGIAQGVWRVAVVAVVAAFFAIHIVNILIGTQIKGVAGTQQDDKTKEDRWDFATQWSLPKKEFLRVLVPGLFGYRMDTPGGGNYWGDVGQDPTIPKLLEDARSSQEAVRKQAEMALQSRFMRHSGAGEYAGVLVVLLAAWAVGQSLRGGQSPFSATERRMVWFWTAMAVVSVLFAFGRHAPFYRIVYALPYFSTIRNPIKFMHTFQMALLVLFGYGLQIFWMRYVSGARDAMSAALTQWKNWWAVARGFERTWVYALLAVIGGATVMWLIYAGSRGEVETHLKLTGFSPEQAPAIVSFSLREVGLFMIFLIASCALMVFAMSGFFGGRREKLALILFGALLFVDLARANAPWIIYYDYREKYASNPVIDMLRARPFEARVTTPQFQLPKEFHLLSMMANEWLQHHYQYFNIQSLDVVQMPRVPEDMRAYRTALNGPPTRLWQLTNTRYLLTAAAMAEPLNQQLDPAQRRFRIATTFDIVPRPGVAQPSRIEDFTALTKTNGQFAIIEFTGALPRAKLYSNWLSATNDDAALKQLADPAFDPWKQLLVAADLPAPKSETATNSAPGEVTFKSYAPKKIVLEANAAVPAVLLLNDKHHPAWKVFVDGQPATLLRCNYLMRGVQLAAGRHEVEFRYEPPLTTLCVSFAALAFGIGLIGYLAATRGKGDAPAESSITPAPPAPSAPGGQAPAKPPEQRRKRR
jgi:hypothetical protein